MRRKVLLVMGSYLLVGLLHSLGTLYCYNVRNWAFMGGFSFPPLYLVGLPFDLILWPLQLWANLSNGLGAFGVCQPL